MKTSYRELGLFFFNLLDRSESLHFVSIQLKEPIDSRKGNELLECNACDAFNA